MGNSIRDAADVGSDREPQSAPRRLEGKILQQEGPAGGRPARINCFLQPQSAPCGHIQALQPFSRETTVNHRKLKKKNPEI